MPLFNLFVSLHERIYYSIDFYAIKDQKQYYNGSLVEIIVYNKYFTKYITR